MCVQKLRDIDDPETVLCRAVLINNTFRTLKTAQRAIMRNARRRVLERKESSEEEEEEEEEKGEKEKGEEDEEISITSPPSEPLPSLRQDSRPNFSESELSDLSCDIGCSDSSMVHSLVMPPLLSPHIEDMTNCSFYDSFGPVDLGVNNQTDEQTNQDQESNVPTNLKLTMMKSDLCDVISETNSNSGTNSFSSQSLSLEVHVGESPRLPICWTHCSPRSARRECCLCQSVHILLHCVHMRAHGCMICTAYLYVQVSACAG